MVHKSKNYFLYDNVDINLEKSACCLAAHPYGIIYVEDNEQIVGAITIEDVVKGIKTGIFNYNSSFVWATNDIEACRYINTRRNIHAVSVMDEKKRIVEHYEEEFIVSNSFNNGIRYKLNNFTGVKVLELLNHFNIKNIKILEIQDTDKELLDIVKKILVSAGVLITCISYDSFLKDLKAESDTNTIWIDAGENYFAQKVRRYIWAKSVNHNNLQSFYFYLKDFLNLLNNASISYDGYERYFKDILSRYRNVAIYGHNSLVLSLTENHPDLINITSKVEVRWNEQKERYELIGPKEKYGLLVVMDWLQADNVQFYYNGIYIFTDLYYYNCENYVTKQYCNTILPELEKNNVHTYFIQLANVNTVLEAAGIRTVSDFIGNEAGYNPVTGKGCEKLYKSFLDYDEKIADCFLMSPNPYMKTLIRGGLFYSTERNPVGIKWDNHKSIHIFGSCLINGVYEIDEDTMGAIIKRQHPEWNVYAHGGLSVDLLEIIQYYNVYHEGDIVILMPALITSINVDVLKEYTKRIIEFSEVYNSFQDVYRRIWQVPLHCNHTVLEKIVQYIILQMELKGVDFKDYERSLRNKDIHIGQKFERLSMKETDSELGEYLVQLKNEMDDTCHNGAIVMNCNPFTKGHRYLIETAARQVERLFIFVVEEDKSFFSFKDRYEMVKSGCIDLDNVTVLPSGRYILSAMTLPGYFEKDDLQDIVLDASTDLELFAYKIAPILHIEKRFVGKEPFDRFTAQYNEEMKRILPLSGIELIEIERIDVGGVTVSASLVREYITEKYYKGVEALVPKSTLDYLIKNSNMI